MTKSIGIIGLGLMGGSLSKGLKRNDYSGLIYGYDNDQNSAKIALGEGVIDFYKAELREVIQSVDILFICTPIGSFEKIFELINKYGEKGLLVSDIGSVKDYVLNLADGVLADNINFVGGHPMVGSELSGYSGSHSDLYDGSNYFLCPRKGSENDVAQICDIVKLLGAKPILIDAKTHDKHVAKTSHMPHLISSLLVKLIDKEGEDVSSFIGGGFKDVTRIAEGNSKLWNDILVQNRHEMIHLIDEFQAHLCHTKNVLLTNDESELTNILEASKVKRIKIMSQI